MLQDSKQFASISASRNALDPSLQGGYTAIYHNKIAININYVNYDRIVKQIDGSQLILIKLYQYGNKNNTEKIKMQISSEYDPFFNLIFECDSQKYQYLKSQQGFNSDFQDFPTVLIKCFNQIQQQCCCKTPQNKKGLQIIFYPSLGINLLVGSDGKAKFVIKQSWEYKNIQIFSLELSPENEQITQEKVSFRYAQLKKKVREAQQKLGQIQEIIKAKNPTLLTQIFKTHHLNQSKLNISQI